MVLSIADFFRKMHRREEGFTLIELLIVIAILAVLAAIAIPLVVNRINEARVSADKANVAQLQSAVDMYMLDKDGGKPLPLLASVSFVTTLVSNGYLQKEVTSPYGENGYKLTTVGTENVVVESNNETKWVETGGGITN